MDRRCLIYVLVMYVGLDLCLASMPGAFVFDPADSVESAQMGRPWQPALETARPAPNPVPAVVPAATVLTRDVGSIAQRARLPVRARYVLPRPLHPPATPSEESD